jgi:hypothetical protein
LQFLASKLAGTSAANAAGTLDTSTAATTLNQRLFVDI